MLSMPLVEVENSILSSYVLQCLEIFEVDKKMTMIMNTGI